MSLCGRVERRAALARLRRSSSVQTMHSSAAANQKRHGTQRENWTILVHSAFSSERARPLLRVGMCVAWKREAAIACIEREAMFQLHANKRIES
jgi:hypothetical protein